LSNGSWTANEGVGRNPRSTSYICITSIFIFISSVESRMGVNTHKKMEEKIYSSPKMLKHEEKYTTSRKLMLKSQKIEIF
jgi:hypothetical protein